MIKRASVALFACLALAAIAAGCGGGGDTTGGGESSEASSAPTKAAFIKEADGVCKAADEELNAEIEAWTKENGLSESKQPTKAQQVEAYEQVVIPNIGKQAEELDALTPPQGDEGTIEEIVTALEEGVEEAESDPEQLAEGKNPLAAASSKARAYGMKVCGSEEG